jgi:DNA polymerase-1
MIPHTPTHIHYITRESEVGPAINQLRFDTLGFDTETYNSFDRRVPAFNPIEGARMRLSQWATPQGRVFVFDHFHVSPSYLYMMFPNRFVCVGQNLKFDFKFLMHELGIDEFGPVYDTMLAGQLLSKGRVTGADQVFVSLDELALRHLRDKDGPVILPKDQQNSDWWKPELDTKQIDYSARDALIVLPIMEKQIQELWSSRQIRVSELEFECVAPLAHVELNGMYLDSKLWYDQIRKHEKQKARLENALWKALAPGVAQTSLFDGIQTINLNSQDQVLDAFRRLALPIPIDPMTNKATLDKKFLKQYRKVSPIIRLLLRYSKVSKALSSYGAKWLDSISAMDGRVHPSIRSIGAETGRMSFRDPAMQTIPQDDWIRNCFTAAPGWVLVGADYSQMELRILAEYCRDPNFLAAFDQDLDLHTYTASLIFKCKMEDVTHKQRAIAKNLNFGIVYGIGVAKFANDAGLTLDEARQIMTYYLEQAYPRMKAWLDQRAYNTVATREADTMTGRVRRYFIDYDDSQSVAQAQRNGKNLPIQGTSVDITKRALALLYKALLPWRRKIKIVHVVHDEIILEALPQFARIAEQILVQCMEQAESEYLRRCKVKVDPDITLCWAKKATKKQKQEALDLIERCAPTV